MKRAVVHFSQVDQELTAWVGRIGAFRMRYRAPDFSTLVRSIVSQQVSTAAAKTVYLRLEKALAGDVVAHSVKRYGMEGLRSVGLSGVKSNYILNLAEAAEGGLNIAGLAKLPDEEVIAQLVQVKGIGVWTAQMFLMFALRRRNVLPVGDLGVRAGFKRVYGREALPTPKELAEFGAIWRPYCSVASWYLWRAMDGDAEL